MSVHPTIYTKYSSSCSGAIPSSSSGAVHRSEQHTRPAEFSTSQKVLLVAFALLPIILSLIIFPSGSITSAIGITFCLIASAIMLNRVLHNIRR